MNRINVYDLQARIKNEMFISVPWFQMEYQLNYSQAKKMIDKLIEKEWIEAWPVGNQYRVRREHLRLRKIVWEEVDSLIMSINNDQLMVLEHFTSSPSSGPRHRIQSLSKSDRKAATEELVKSNLIYPVGETYRPCVSRRVYEVLTSVMSIKRMNERRHLSIGEEAMTEMRMQFKMLIDE